jgi:DNA-directed RNA polymerase specialized sigma24 family protein
VYDSPSEVIRGLLTYTDWWQPATTSVLQVGAARRASDLHDGIRDGLLDSLDFRAELCRRMQHVGPIDRKILFLWYIRQLAAQDIARAVGVSRRQCFRRRARAIRKLIEVGETETNSEPAA